VKKSSAQLEREIADMLAHKPMCSGVDADTILQTSLTDAKRLKQAEVERCYLATVMKTANGSISAGARLAGIDRTNFRRLLNRYGIR
jgi:transcriptional regulator of acetoin/glycerol metabolism